jgi:hypothetical protein
VNVRTPLTEFTTPVLLCLQRYLRRIGSSICLRFTLFTRDPFSSGRFAYELCAVRFWRPPWTRVRRVIDCCSHEVLPFLCGIVLGVVLPGRTTAPGWGNVAQRDCFGHALATDMQPCRRRRRGVSSVGARAWKRRKQHGWAGWFVSLATCAREPLSQVALGRLANQLSLGAVWSLPHKWWPGRRTFNARLLFSFFSDRRNGVRGNQRGSVKPPAAINAPARDRTRSFRASDRGIGGIDATNLAARANAGAASWMCSRKRLFTANLLCLAEVP